MQMHVILVAKALGFKFIGGSKSVCNITLSVCITKGKIEAGRGMTQGLGVLSTLAIQIQS